MTDVTKHLHKPGELVLGSLALTGVVWMLLWSLIVPNSQADEPATEAQESEAAEAAKRPKNALKWSTASEIDTFGYHVYRGLAEEGPFERLTDEPILGAGSTDETSHYEFVDDTIDPYTAYWYYVESVSKKGQQERFTPIFRQPPAWERTSLEPEADSPEEKSDSDPE